ncbi:hypothetical protein [Serratia sp. M24T3]|uniref:Bacteriocin n=1 Tax=Rouxiella sp. WC2420 TaxID=3234145 RepID=A0AB39VJQ1_9GAMM|nr:hypothetical protein [Serratia sp. M24T3]
MNNDNGLRELSLDEIEQVSGGFVLDLSPIIKADVDLGAGVDGLVSGLSSLLGLGGILHL